MSRTSEIIRDAESLPVEERALVVESLLHSLNAPDPTIDEKWAIEATLRLEQIRSGESAPVPGEEVFERIFARFGR